MWQYDGVAWRTLVTSQGVRSPTRTVFTASGTYTIPTGCTAYDVEVVGAGGGGGSCAVAGAIGSGQSGGGGGGGGYAKKLIQVNATISAATKTITVGTGGAAQTGGGASSYADGTSTLTGGGGAAGVTGAPSSASVARGGGNGGTASGGDINVAGMPGQAGWSGGSITSGTSAATVIGGNGGNSMLGGGGNGVAVGTTAGGTAGAGAAGSNYGGGGAGSTQTNSAGTSVGGAGAPGLVVITEYYTGESPSVRTTADEENLICNPDFIVSQENGSTAITATGYFADQWLGSSVSGGAITWQQFLGVQTPGRATGRMLVTTIDAAVAATDYAGFFQNIEGYVIRDLMWGSAAAKPVVLRFSFYTNVAGTYCACIKSGASDLSYAIPFSHPGSGYVDYTFAIPGPTTGTWAADYTKGMIFSVCGMAGTTYQAPSANAWVAGNYLATSAIGNIMATVNNEMRLGKVGLYADPNNTGIAPPFKIPDFAAELAKCKRYWQNVYGYWSGQITSGSTYTQISYCAVAPRISSPTVSAANSSAANFPTTPGTPSFVGPATIRESRAASATAGAGNFATFFDVSARL